MDRFFGITLDVIFTFFGITNLLSVGADYRHILAGFAGSIFVTTFLQKSRWDKLWYSGGGFSFASFVGPAICEYYGCDSQSALCIAIYFGSGTIGMLLVQLLVTIANAANGSAPSLVKSAATGANAFIRKWFNQTPNNNDPGQN